MQQIDNRQKNLNLRLAEINTASCIEEHALSLEVKQVKLLSATQVPEKSENLASKSGKNG